MTEMTEQFADSVLHTLGESVPGKLIDFGRALDEGYGDLDWPYFLSKPYKWSAEFAAWQSAGLPSGEGDAGWDKFCEHIGAV